MNDLKCINIHCNCTKIEHDIRISYFEDEDDMFIGYYLESRSFFKRLILGIKYIFGYRCKYGHFGETVIDKSSISKFKEIINHLEKFKDETI